MRRPASKPEFLFRQCSEAHREVDERPWHALRLPDWIESATKGRASLIEMFNALEAAVLLAASSRNDGPLLLPGLHAGQSLRTPEILRTALDRMEARRGPAYLFEQAVQSAWELSRVDAELDDQGPPAHLAQALQRLLAHACGRQASAAVPPDVASLMAARVECQGQIDVYPRSGVGLYLGLCDRHDVRLATELGTDQQDSPSYALGSTAAAFTATRRAELADRGFEELFLRYGKRGTRGHALLVNAANLARPLGPQHHETRTQEGALNHLLSLGYEDVIVLVRNNILTGGRELADKLFEFFDTHGLRELIQLPAGTLGSSSTVHSLLVFRPAAQIHRISFAASQSTAQPPTGFGYPRRSKALPPPDVILAEISKRSSLHSLAELKSPPATDSRKKRLRVSYEAKGFIKDDPFHGLPNDLSYKKLAEVAQVFRSHYMQNSGDGQSVRFREVGAGAVGSLGEIDLDATTQTSCDKEAFEARMAQVLMVGDILMCFRGARDAIGRTGRVRNVADLPLVPNQSFVIIRLRPDAGVSPTYLHWWLQSEYVRKYISAKAISPSVPRIAPADLKQLMVPIGPEAYLRKRQAEAELFELLIVERATLEERLRGALKSGWAD